MTRHEPLSAQTATPPSQPAGDLAPFDGRAVMNRLLAQTRRGKFGFIGPFIAPRDPGAAPPAPGQCTPQAGQIQKHP